MLKIFRKVYSDDRILQISTKKIRTLIKFKELSISRHILPKILQLFLRQQTNALDLIIHLMNFPLPSNAAFDLPFPQQLARIRQLVLRPVYPIHHQVFVKFYSSQTSFNEDHSWKFGIFVSRLYHKSIEGQLLSIHVHFEYLSGIYQFFNPKDSSSTLLRAIPFQLPQSFVFFLRFREFSRRIGLIMAIDSFLGLLFGLGLNFTRINYKLIFHYDCHISNSQLRFIRLNKSKLDFVILLQQFLLFPLSFQLFALLFRQVHRQYYSGLLLSITNLLKSAISAYHIEINYTLPSKSGNPLYFLFIIYTFI